MGGETRIEDLAKNIASMESEIVKQFNKIEKPEDKARAVVHDNSIRQNEER